MYMERGTWAYGLVYVFIEGHGGRGFRIVRPDVGEGEQQGIYEENYG
jgi:hypothetical protein